MDWSIILINFKGYGGPRDFDRGGVRPPGPRMPGMGPRGLDPGPRMPGMGPRGPDPGSQVDFNLNILVEIIKMFCPILKVLSYPPHFPFMQLKY